MPDTAAADEETHLHWWSGVDDDRQRNNPAIARPRPSEPREGPIGPPGMPPSTWTGPAYSAAVRPVNVATSTERSVYVWAFFTLLGGAAVIVGSVTTWLRITGFGHTVNVAGTDTATSTVQVRTAGHAAVAVATTHFHASHGWITLVLGGGIVLFAALLVPLRPTLLRLVSVLASLGALGYGIYEIVDIQSHIDSARQAARNNLFALVTGVNAHIGYGLIVVVAGAGVAVLASFGAARRP